MKSKLRVISPFLVFCFLLIQLYYLKILPCSFVRIYYTSEPEDFNKAPAGQSMSIKLDGYTFSYYIPNRSGGNVIIDELNERGIRSDPHALNTVISIANWTREKLTFGMHAEDGNFVVEDILPYPPVNGLKVLCNSYARLCALASQSQGIAARIIELGGHVVMEAFIGERSRWVMIDPMYGYYMTKDNEPLSAAEIIDYYKRNVRLTPIVFAENKNDDCRYDEKHEAALRAIYLNGFTVVSDHTLDRERIKNTIFASFQLPIAKMQFIGENSMLIGRQETRLRYSIVTTILVLIVLSIVIAKRRHR